MRTGRPLTMDRQGPKPLAMGPVPGEVAVHFPGCTCHRVNCCCDTSGPSRRYVRLDKSGNPWHVGPGCKPRATPGCSSK
jgi:hypothetical protein